MFQESTKDLREKVGGKRGGKYLVNSFVFIQDSCRISFLSFRASHYFVAVVALLVPRFPSSSGVIYAMSLHSTSLPDLHVVYGCFVLSRAIMIGPWSGLLPLSHS